MSDSITVDLNKAKEAAKRLKANPPHHDDIHRDPKGFLASVGVTLDDATLSKITSKLTGKTAHKAKAAAIVHIDA